MIATWMLFGVVTATLLAVASALIEPVLLRTGRAVRWLWVAAMWGAVVVLALALRTPAPERSIAEIPVARGLSSTTAPVTLISAPLTIVERMTATRLITTPVVGLVERLAMLDRPLAWAWATTSIALLALLVASGSLISRGLVDTSATFPTQAAVVFTEQIGPAAVGVIRPRIVLPSWVRSLEPELRALILRHEREHLIARDPLTLLACVSLVVLLPWNAPLWWMLRRLRAAIELDCDARVLRVEPDVRRYASLLLLMGARRELHTPLMRVAAMSVMPMSSGRRALQRRIEAMTTPRRARPSSAGTFALVGAMALLAMALLAMAMLVPAPERLDATQVQPISSKATTNDSVIEFRYLLRESGYLLKNRKRGATIYEFAGAEKLLDPYGGFRTLKVTTLSGKSAEVQLYVEREPSERASRTDTAVFRTPFQLTLWAQGMRTHIRSVRGDSLVMSSPVAVAAPFATRSVGRHFVLQGINVLGLPVP